VNPAPQRAQPPYFLQPLCEIVIAARRNPVNWHRIADRNAGHAAAPGRPPGASRRHIKPPLARYAVKVEGRGQFFEDAIWPVLFVSSPLIEDHSAPIIPTPPVESIQTASIHKPKIKACTTTIGTL